MDHPPGSMPAQRRTTLAAFLVLLSAVMVLTAPVVLLGVVLVIIAPLAFLVTKAIQQGIAIGQGLAEGGVSLRSLLDHVGRWAPIETIIGSPEAFENQAHRWMQSAGTGATATIL